MQLTKKRQGTTPDTTFALLAELIHRDGLPLALANRHDLSLEPILKFLVKHVTDARHCTLACDVASVLIGSASAALLSNTCHSLLIFWCPEIYSPTLGLSPLVDGLFSRLRRRVSEELQFQRELMGIRGALDMIFASSQSLKV